MEPWSYELAGRFDEHAFESEVLKGNPLGDPHERPLWVYVPPGYDEEADRRYPSVYMIQGLTGQLDMWRNRTPFRRNFPELADELFAAGEAPPCVCVWVDCWTSLGGSQFLDSPGTGDYHTYLCEEIVPWPADPDGTVRLPFDPATSELLPEVWARWLAWDPVRMVSGHADALRGMRAIYIDAGKRDQWFLDLGAEAFRRALERVGVTDVYFEIFDATHVGIDY